MVHMIDEVEVEDGIDEVLELLLVGQMVEVEDLHMLEIYFLG